MGRRLRSLERVDTMYGGQQPIFILKEGTSRTRGKGAQSNNIAAAKAVADAVRTTLGPKGMDKILQSMTMGGNITITNDGATILKSIHIDNAAAKVLVEISKTQDDEVGDGTTSVVVLAGELLSKLHALHKVLVGLREKHPLLGLVLRVLLEKSMAIIKTLDQSRDTAGRTHGGHLAIRFTHVVLASALALQVVRFGKEVQRSFVRAQRPFIVLHSSRARRS